MYHLPREVLQKRESLHLHKVLTWSNMVGPWNFQMALIASYLHANLSCFPSVSQHFHIQFLEEGRKGEKVSQYTVCKHKMWKILWQHCPSMKRHRNENKTQLSKLCVQMFALNKFTNVQWGHLWHERYIYRKWFAQLWCLQLFSHLPVNSGFHLNLCDRSV